MIGFIKAGVGAVALLFLASEYLPDIIDDLLMQPPPSPETSSGRPQQWGPYKEEDCSVDGSTSRAYTLHVDEDVLVDLKERLVKRRPPGAPMEHTDGWEYGIDADFMEKLIREWRDNYDWRKHEARLNAVGLSETVVDGLKIRMHHIRRGEGQKAILLLHGWPGSILEFHQLIELMQKHDALNQYSIVCPSLPGYGFSTAPTIEGYNTVAMAGTMQRLMEKLGYTNYIVQGGDWGSMVAQTMAYLNSAPIQGLHLNFFPVFTTPGHFLIDAIKVRLLDSEESLARLSNSRDMGLLLKTTGYLHQQATKPETLSHALSDSPAGLCAWIAEKFQSWSDQSIPVEEKFHMDDILTNCMIYWVTNSITPSIRLYKEFFQTNESSAVLSTKVMVPVGLSLFPHELFPPADSIMRRQFQNIALFRKHEKGGHFAALEHPELLLGDIVEFVQLVQ